MPCQLWIEIEFLSIFLHKIMQTGLWMSIQLLVPISEYQKYTIVNIFMYDFMPEDSDYDSI